MNFSLRFNRQIGAEKAPIFPSELTGTRRRRNTLKRVDRELLKGNYRAALYLVKSAGLRGFGAAKQIQSLDDLNAETWDISSLQTRLDLILNSIKNSIHFTSSRLSLLELESLVHRSSGDCLLNDHLKCMQHEAGHFLVGYLLGVLPKGYKVPSMEDLNQDKLTGGRVDFLGLEFLKEVDTDGISNYKLMEEKHFDETVCRIISVIIGGLVAEHLVFGCSVGLHSDVEKMYSVLARWDFKDDEADFQIKRAALNAVLILDRQYEARSRLAEAMALGRSVGNCIDTIENALKDPVVNEDRGKTEVLESAIRKRIKEG